MWPILHLSRRPGGRTRQAALSFTASLAFLLGYVFAVSPAWSSCPYPSILWHGASGYLDQCIDSRSLAGLALSLASPGSIDSGGLDLICEVEDATTTGGMLCSREAGSPTDGRVTVQFDWSLPGAAGCPVPNGQAGYDGRIVLILAADDGSSLLASVGYWQDAGGYLMEAAQPYDGSAFSPLSCGAAGADVLRLDQISASDGQVTADLTLFAPRIFSDCDSGTAGQLTGTCPGGPHSIPPIGLGRLYSRTGACPESGAVTDLRIGAWSLAGAPDGEGHVTVTLLAPPDTECLFLGATFTLGGVETPAVGGFVRFPAPACRDADFDAVTDCDGDCDETDPEVFPEHPEGCDAVDNDCDGAIDEDGACEVTCPNPGKIGGDVRVTLGSGFPDLVWTGDGYALVWIGGTTGIYFARLDATGVKIGADVRINSGDASWLSPSLVRAGSGFGAAWHDFVPSPTVPNTGSSAARMARLDAFGQRIGSDFRVPDDERGSYPPSIAWSGSEYGVAWTHPNRTIDFARFDASGNKLGPDREITPQAAWSNALPRIVWAGSEYGLSWWKLGSGEGIHFARLDPDGAGWVSDIEVAPSYPPPSPYALNPPDLVWTGSGFGVAWETGDNWVHPEIKLARLSATGTKIGLATSISSDAFPSTLPSLTWTGAEYGIAWLDTRDGNPEIYFARVSPSGAKLGPDLRVTDDPAWTHWPSLAWNGNGFGVAWSDLRDGGGIYFARIGCDCVDADGDGFTSCQECDDTAPASHPGAAEVCDSLDNDCDGFVDEGQGLIVCGTGTCARTVSACLRGLQPVCDPGEPGIEICDGLDNDCNGLVDDSSSGSDSDSDGILNACDNCALAVNPGQGNVDGDGEGDVCDLDDGLIWVDRPDASTVAWQAEQGFGSFNLYRGDLAVLRQSGEYTQDPAVVPQAMRACGIAGTSLADGPDPGPGQAFIYLVTGNCATGESSLGLDSSGRPRTNSHSCP